MVKTTLTAFLCALQLASFQSHANNYNQALDHLNRSTEDKALDIKRKPAQVLEFFEIKPEMKVLDVFAGGGYYSEILSYLVGPRGKVTLYNNAPWEKFVSKAVNERLSGERLPNVQSLTATPESLIERTEHYDAAIFILGMHDLYYADPSTGWVAIDKALFLKGIYERLNKGAVFGVIDANAMTGADNLVIGEKLHRVDPLVVIKDIEAAGFVLEAQGEFLRNSKDDLNTSVFLPENRYNTDRSVLKFRKPL
jgi:predicted methyltransferase